jgi:restriction system protein
MTKGISGLWVIPRCLMTLVLVDDDKLVEMFEKVELGVTPKTIYEPNMSFFEEYREKK